MLIDDVDDAFLLVDSLDNAQCAVDPATVEIVLDEDDLCAGLDVELHGCGQAVLRELVFYFAEEERRLTSQLREMLLVDIVDSVAARRQRDGQFRAAQVERGTHTAVELLQVGGCNIAGADMVENLDEGRIGLPVHLLQLDAHEPHLAEYMGIEEKGRGIEGLQKTAVLFFHHGLELVDVAHEQQLLAAKGLAHVA